MRRIALPVAGAAVAGLLTACSHPAAPAAAPASHAPARVPVSCSQQYHAWKLSSGKNLIAVLNDVSSAVRAGDTHALTLVLKKARPTVATAARHPIPACADPRGYWDVLLMHVNAGVASKGSASSVHAALTDVPRLQHELMAEVKHAST